MARTSHTQKGVSVLSSDQIIRSGCRSTLSYQSFKPIDVLSNTFVELLDTADLHHTLVRQGKTKIRHLLEMRRQLELTAVIGPR